MNHINSKTIEKRQIPNSLTLNLEMVKLKKSQ